MNSAQYEPEEALSIAQGFLHAHYPKAKPEYVWSVVHHEYGTWLHLDVFDLAKQPTRPAKKYNRADRYRYSGIISMPVCEANDGPLGCPMGRCKSCTALWRDLNGYGFEDDIDAIDDLPFYQRKEQM